MYHRNVEDDLSTLTIMTTNTDKRRICHMAKAIFDADNSIEWPDCMKRAWDFHWFRQQLVRGIVNFRYWKADGTLREARGTLLMDVIPEDKRPKGTSTHKPNYKNMAYYDLDREDWRSFDINHYEGQNRSTTLVSSKNLKEKKKQKKKNKILSILNS